MQDPAKETTDIPPNGHPSMEETCHVLLVEDDPAHIDLVIRAFRRNGGQFRLTYAQTLRDARPILARDPPCLIIADWKLPDGNGIELLPVKDGQVATPLIVLTSHGNEQLAVEVMKSGAIDYLVKSPTVFRDLPQIASRVLREWTNIRMREEAQQEARETEKRLADTIAFLPDAVMAIDDHGVIIAWNGAMEALTGVRGADMVGKGNYEYSIPIYGDRRPILIDLVRRTDAEIEQTYDFIRREGDRITSETFVPGMHGGTGAYLWGTAAPLYDTAGNTIGAIEVIRDITERKRAETALRESEEKYRFLLENVRDVVWQANPDLVFTYLSPSVDTILGYPPGNLVGKSLFSLLTDASREVIKKRLAERIEESRRGIRDLATVFEINMVKADRDTAWFEVSANALTGPDGSIVAFQGISRDISERKRVEKALRESEEKFRTLFESMDVGVFYQRNDGSLIDANEAALSMFGLTRDEFIGRNSFDPRWKVIDEEGNTISAEEHPSMAALRTGRPVKDRVVGVFNPAKQTYTWLSVSAEPQFSPAGDERPSQVYVTLNNITERKRAEEALRESEVRFRNLLQHIPSVAVQGYRMDGTTSYWNEASERFYGYSPEEALGKNILDLIIPPEMHTEVSAAIRQMAETGLPIPSAELSLMKKGGDRIAVYSSHAVVRKSDGSLELFCIDVDMTERKRAEEIRNAYEARLETAMEIGSLAWWEMNLPDGSVRFDSRKAGMLGYPMEKFRTYTDFMALVHPDDYEPTMQAMRDHLEGRQERYSTSYRIRTAAGNYRWFRDVGGITRRHPDGTPATITGIAIDITTAQEAAEALRISEDRLRFAQESARIGLWDRDTRTGSLVLSPQLEEQCGVQPGTITTLDDLNRRILPEDLPRAVKEREEAIAAHRQFNVEYRIRREDTGEVRWISSIGSARYDDEGRPVRISGVGIDITDRKQAEEALRESEKRYRDMFEINSAIMLLIDAETGRISDANAAACRYYGYTRDEMTALGISAINTMDPAAIREEMEKAKGSRGAVFQFRHKKKNGEIRDVEVFSGPITMNGREYLHSIIHDVTERKHAEEALADNRDYLDRIFSSVQSGIVVIDAKTHEILDLNPAATAMIGSPREEILHKTCHHFICPADAGNCPITDLNRPVDNSERILLSADGRKVPIIKYVARVTIHGRECLLETFIDNTDRKRTEIALRESEERFRQISESTGVWIWETDADGMYTYASPVVESILGYTPDELVGKRHFYDLFDPATQDVLKEAALQAIGRRSVIRRFVNLNVHKDGSRVFLETNGVPILDHGGNLTGYRGTDTDITDRIRAQEELQQSEERYRTLVEELPDFVIVHRDGDILYVNAAISRVLGKSAENLIHSNIMAYIAPESREAVLNALDRRRNGGPVAPYTARLLMPDDTTRWVEIRGAGIMFGGRPASFNVLTDITEKKWAEEALFESEKKFRTVADFTYDWEYWTSPAGEYIYVSPSAERISGYTPGEFYRDKDLIKKIVLAEDRQILAEHQKGLSARPDHQTLEIRIRRKDGKVVWLGHICQPIFSPDGQYLGRRGSNRDITGQKEAVDALQASEVRFRSLIQNSSDIIRILDHDRKIVYESPSSERILGYPAGSLTGKDPGEFIHPDDRSRVGEDFGEVIAGTNTGIPTEFRIRRADGSWLWVDAIGVNLLDTPGVDGIVINIRPIQQRKLMENEIRENQDRLATAMDMAHLVNWEYDVKTETFTFNDRFYALYGTSAEREGGYRMPAAKYIAEFVHQDDRANASRMISGAASISDPEFSAEIEHRILRRDGEMRYVSVRFGVILDAGGNAVKTRGANQDITDRKMLESEIRSLNAVLEQRVVQRTDELNKSLLEKELLLREIHHRVKNNLQIIISILRLQKRQVTDDGTLAALMDSESRVRSMALVHEKLYRSKDLEHIDVGDYLRALTQYLFTTYAVDNRRIRFLIEISSLSLDIQRAIPIGLIINELLTNALKHAFPEGMKGEIRITGKRENRQIVILIEDNGIGIPEGFDWRNSPSLGMHLVMTLIEQVRGTIELAAGTPGTHFVITLPENERGGR